MKQKMKKLFGALLALTLVLGMMPGMSMTVRADDWILISTTEQLKNIGNDAAYPLNGNYKLIADIDMDSMIGSGDNAFTGTFDGNGHTIHLSITTNNTYSTGLFGKVNGTVENLITTGNVSGTGNNTGAISAGGGGTFRNCWNKANVTGSAAFASGILGYHDAGATIINCLNTGAINNTNTGTGVAGGITCTANINSNPRGIERCFSTKRGNSTNYGYFLVGGADQQSKYSVDYCYYAGSAGEGAYGGEGTGLSGADLTNTSSYSGWDFDNTWRMTDEGPRLRMPFSAPTFTPEAGSYTSEQSVAIATTYTGAKIYYTVNGDTPTTGSTEYTGPIKVSKTTTIKAIAVKDEVNSEVASATYTFNVASVTTAPTAKTLTYTGSAQELVTAGTATGGEMQYALGTATEATQPYTTSIPTATDVGTYYVWYKVVGDTNHNDTEPKCVTVNIAQNESESETEKQTESETEKQDPIPSGGGGGSIPQATTPVTIPAETVEEPTKEELQVPASIFLNSGFLVSWSGSKVRVTWGSVPEADHYEIYANYCGNKSCVRVASVSGATSAILKKLNGKKIKTKKFVKAYVIAFKNGVAIGRTILGHAAGPKSAYTNAKAVSVDQSAYQLKAGEAAKVSATITKAKKNKKLPGINHGAKLRYASTNEGVATVDGNGVITAVGSGTCEVWIYALNGRSAKVTVNVN